MDRTESLSDGIIKVDVVQMKTYDGAGERLWNYTELGEMRTVASSVNEESSTEVPSILVIVQPFGEAVGTTTREQDATTLETLFETPETEYSSGKLGSCESVETQNADLSETQQAVLQIEVNPETYQQNNVRSDEYQSSAHKKPFECPICKARYSHSPSLIRHKRIHTGQRPFVCSICKKDFVHNASLIFHMRTHTGEKPFECSICHKRFSQNGTLTVHLRTHTGEQPFECPICQKRFATKSQASVHTFIHTNNKPFICSVCDRSFSRRMYLIEHLQTHTGKRPYECAICQKGFSRKMFLTIHLQSHTNEKLYE